MINGILSELFPSRPQQEETDFGDARDFPLLYIQDLENAVLSMHNRKAPCLLGIQWDTEGCRWAETAVAAEEVQGLFKGGSFSCPL